MNIVVAVLQTGLTSVFSSATSFSYDEDKWKLTHNTLQLLFLVMRPQQQLVMETHK